VARGAGRARVFETCLEHISAEEQQAAMGVAGDQLHDDAMRAARHNLARLLHDMGYAVNGRTLDAVSKRTSRPIRCLVLLC
jgi:hypothetical protein